MDIITYLKLILQFLIIMATIKLTIFKAKVLKDGSHKIRVAICHKQETCYIITRFKIDNLSQFKNGQVVKQTDAAVTNTKLRNLLNKYQDRLDSIGCISLYDCKQLREILINVGADTIVTTFQTVSSSYIKELIEDKRENYATLLERNCRYFTEFTRGDFLLSEITPQIVNNYARFLRNTRKLGETSIGMAMSRTRTIINRAKREQLVKYDIDPFEYYSIQAAPERELDISKEDFIKIRDCKPKEKQLRVARDLFCLSYYLGGINLIDLLAIDFRNAKQIEYIRTKSRNTKKGDRHISLTIPDEAKPIIKEWINKNTGKLDFGYKFTYSNFSRYLSRCIAALAVYVSVERKVVYYSARKSFVQHGFEIGIPLEVLEYCIGQSMKANRPIYNYLKVMRSHADDAIRRILDGVR